MKRLLLALALIGGCSVAGSSSEALRAPSADAGGDAGGTPCGNGGTVCADDEVCYHNNCLTICGSATCWAKLQAAYGQCGN